MMNHPLAAVVAQKAIRECLNAGIVVYTTHVKKRLEQRNMDINDVRNVLRAGAVEGQDFENSTWRYHVGTPKMVVIVAFEAADSLVIVTAWRRS